MKVVTFLVTLALSFSAGVAIDSFDAHKVEATNKPNVGKELYEKYCADCHHKDRIGHIGPPLFPKFLRKYKLKDLSKKIKNGFPQTLMPSYEFLNAYELLEISRYIKSEPTNIKWSAEDITKSIKRFEDPKKPLDIHNIEDVLPVVERDGNKVWVMEDTRILAKFPVNNVHGGIKYSLNEDNYGEFIYVPTRDGYIQKYSLKDGQRKELSRACVTLRNTSLSRDGKHVLTTCLLPEQMVVLDSQDLTPKKITKIEGKVSALYEFYSKDEAIFTFRDKPLIAKVDTKTFEISYTKIKEPIEDFFIDPFEDYLIGTSRGGGVLSVINLKTNEYVFEHEMKGMPHLFSATYWYKDGNFYFATPHIKKPYITVWKMYDWKFEKEVPIGGDGFFVKTHPNTPYLWCYNGSDELLLISKKDYSIKKIVPRKGKQYIHTEYSGDGKYAYLSIYEKDGEIIVLDTTTLKELAAYDANIPVGKYNFINKNRQFYPRLFGLDMVNQRGKDIDTSLLNAYEKRSLSHYLDSLK
jgi:mono/diheme cytochrome c family protein